MAHWPTRKSVGRRPSRARRAVRSTSTFSSTSIRLWSVATSLAGSRVPSARATKIESGFCTKLNALETMKPSAETTRPVVGPVPTSTSPTRSSPPTVSIRTTAGATRSTAARMACSSSSAERARRGSRAAQSRQASMPRKSSGHAERRTRRGNVQIPIRRHCCSDRPLIMLEMQRPARPVRPLSWTSIRSWLRRRPASPRRRASTLGQLLAPAP